MPDDKTWHSGPPPSIGWWPASYFQDPSIYRWWDGKLWSVGAVKECVVPDVIAAQPEHPNFQPLIEWRHRPSTWPKRSFT